MNILMTLTRALALWPDREALVDGDVRLTYRQFGQRVNRLARALMSRGAGRGSVVGIIAPNGHEYMEAYYGAALAGAVLTPQNYRLSVREIAAILEDAGAQLLIAHENHRDLTVAVIQECPAIKHVLWVGAPSPLKAPVESTGYEDALAAEAAEPLPDPSLQGDDLAHLYYTSGTTGRPKGVMLSHANVTFHAYATIPELRLSDADAWLHAAPMFHLADAWATFSLTLVGGKHVFVPTFQAEAVLATIERERVTATVLVPTMVNAMLNHPSAANYDYQSLRLIMTGGAPIAPEVVRKIVNTFDCEYSQLYGMTETSPILTLSFLKSHMRDWPEDRRFATSCRTGRPFLGAEVKVVRPDSTEVEHDDEDVGEIVARGPSVTSGYWKQPEATAQTIRDGWLHTGDLAVVDEEGYIKIVDRQKDMIVTGGENVYSTEVEHTLYEHPAVLECAVMGVPDEVWGEAVKAVVVLRPSASASAEELIAFTKTRLAGYKAPRSIDFLPELPKTGSGKIYKKGLRDGYWSGHRVKVN